MRGDKKGLRQRMLKPAFQERARRVRCKVPRETWRSLLSGGTDPCPLRLLRAAPLEFDGGIAQDGVVTGVIVGGPCFRQFEIVDDEAEADVC
jgi:hypothetical protein